MAKAAPNAVARTALRYNLKKVYLAPVGAETRLIGRYSCKLG